MSRRVVIYCRDKAARANRAAVAELRDVVSRERWKLVGTFVEGAGPSRPEYDQASSGTRVQSLSSSRSSKDLILPPLSLAKYHAFSWRGLGPRTTQISTAPAF